MRPALGGHDERASTSAGDFITSLSVQPDRLRLADARDQRRVLVTGHTVSGKRIDLTAVSSFAPTSAHLVVGSDGYLSPRKRGRTVVRVTAGRRRRRKA